MMRDEETPARVLAEEAKKQFLFTSMNGRLKDVPIPCRLGQTKGLRAAECMRQDVSHRGLQPQMGRSMVGPKPTRTGGHPNWADVAEQE